jgi:phosphate transport system permease protein
MPLRVPEAPLQFQADGPSSVTLAPGGASAHRLPGSINASAPKPPGTRDAEEPIDRRDTAWFIDKVVAVLVFIGGVSAILFILGIFAFVTREGVGFLRNGFHVVEFFTSPKWRPTSDTHPTFGILALVVGTASVTGLAMAVSVPFSLGAALYISEFAKGRTKEVLKVLVELLAAIPSVVWGFVGLAIMNPLIIKVFNVPVGLGIFNSGIILGLMAAPIMTTIAEDALKAVPDNFREAAEAIGATRWQVATRVVLPAAKHGLVAAILLGVGRGFGETMAVLMASGHAINLPTSIFDSVRALTATIAAELGETAVGSQHYEALFTLGILLFVVTFFINLMADVLVRRTRRA